MSEAGQRLAFAAAIASLAVPVAAVARDAGEAPVASVSRSGLELDSDRSVFDGDHLIVGIGPILAPSYEGSNDLILTPGAGIAGSLGGIGISPRAGGASFDLVRDKKGARSGFTLGPVIRYRFNRTGDAHDEVVDKLGKLPGVVEAGVVVGADFKGVLNPYDSLSMSTDVRFDISGHGGGMIIVPGISYITPVSRADVAGIAISGSFVDDSYARYSFSISPAGAAASGLPVYDAHGGFNNFSIGAFVGHDLSGNLLNGGFVIGGGLMFSQLFGSAAESPITSIRGKASQLILGAGLAYTF